MEKLLAFILAGGRGERLSVLSQERAKPAIPFAGKYRIIDFTLSNCVNSGIHNVAILTQYQPSSITEHVGIGTPWGLVPPNWGVKILQPFPAPERGRDWYKGTADAVFQNLDRIEQEKVEEVLILSGDHVYKMDYTPMIEFHQDNHADVTMAVTRIPEEDLHRFGTVVVDEKGRAIQFEEKVKNPKSDLASMGVYVFKKRILRAWLEGSDGFDFGNHIFPQRVGTGQIFTYRYNDYWRDIGTISSYWQANIDMLWMPRSFLYDKEWPIHTNESAQPPSLMSSNANVANSLLSSGCSVDGRITHSVISPGVTISENAVIKDSVIMNGCYIGKGSIVEHSIIDEDVVIGDDCKIGVGNDCRPNRRFPKMLDYGLTVIGTSARIPSGITIGRNCIIYSRVVEDNFLNTDVPSGITVMAKNRIAGII